MELVETIIKPVAGNEVSVEMTFSNLSEHEVNRQYLRFRLQSPDFASERPHLRELQKAALLSLQAEVGRQIARFSDN